MAWETHFLWGQNHFFNSNYIQIGEASYISIFYIVVRLDLLYTTIAKSHVRYQIDILKNNFLSLLFN